jgi:ADP-heptose:LPS heptosyltransferase
MNLLFVTATRVGDAVLSTGLLAYLVERHPDAVITVAAGPVAAPLFEAVPRLSRLIVMDKRRYGMHWLRLYGAIAGRRWDLVVDLRSSALGYFLWAGERRITAKADRREHRVRELGRLFALDPPPAPQLWTSPAHQAAAAVLVPAAGPVLAVAPAANWRGKQWRGERFAELARRLVSPGGLLSGARVVVLAAAHERAQAEPLLAAFAPEQTIDLVGRTDLLTAAAVLQRAQLFIGNDTGLMHVAAAVGTPTLGLFGPSPAARFAPWGPHAAIVQTALSPEALVAAPDYDYRTTDTLMDSLSVEAAHAGAEGLWARIADV